MIGAQAYQVSEAEAAQYVAPRPRKSLPRSPVGKLLRRELTPTSQDTPVQR